MTDDWMLSNSTVEFREEERRHRNGRSSIRRRIADRLLDKAAEKIDAGKEPGLIGKAALALDNAELNPIHTGEPQTLDYTPEGGTE